MGEGSVFTRVCPSIHLSVCPHPHPDWLHGGRYASCIHAGGLSCLCEEFKCWNVIVTNRSNSWCPIGIRKLKQESPPAWTQEAYWLQQIKYYPRWGTPCWGTPSQVWWGTQGGVPPSGYPLVGVPPQPGLMGSTWGGVSPHQGTPLGQVMMGGGYLRWGTPCQGVPHQGTPSQVWWEGTQGGIPPSQCTPLPGPTGGYPRWVPHPCQEPPDQVQWWGCTQGGVPPQQGYPPAGPAWGTPCWTWPGYPLGVDRQIDGWTDTCQNITFPRTTYAVSN